MKPKQKESRRLLTKTAVVHYDNLEIKKQSLGGISGRRKDLVQKRYSRL